MMNWFFHKRYHSKKFYLVVALLLLPLIIAGILFPNKAAYANLFSNPGCETSTSTWNGYNATLARSTAFAHSGTASCLATRTTSDYYTIDDIGYVVTNPKQGDVYVGTVWVRSDTAVGKNTQLILRLDEGKPTQKVFTAATTLTTSWQKLTVTATIDTTTRTSLDFYVVQYDAVAGNSFYADDMDFYLSSGITPTPTPSGTPADWCNDTTGVTCTSAWQSRRKITINNAASGSNLTNFPILVKLDSSRINYSKTQNAGEDIRFVDPADKTVSLNHEIETWNESGSSYVWVKVPQLDAGSTSDYIWMYYNNPSAVPPATQLGSIAHATGTWDSNFKGVYHLNQDPGAAGNGGIVDSTNQNNGTDTGSMVSANSVNGKVGKGIDFDGTDDFIDLGTGNIYSTNASQMTITAWGALDDLTAGHTIVGGGGAAAVNNQFKNNKDGELEYWESTPRSSSYGSQTLIAGIVDPNVFNHFAMTLDVSNDQGKFYVNRNLLKSFSYTASNIVGKQFIGKYSTAGDFWKGVLDEVRISFSVRSPDWIEAEYLTSADGMNTFSAEQSLTSGQTLVKAVNFNGGALDVDGVAYQAESAAGVTFPSGVTRVTNSTITPNPAVSTNKTNMLRAYTWRGSAIQFNVDVTVPNGSYLVYLYSWEDSGPTTFNLGFENQIVASNLSSGAAGSWSKLGPYPVTVVDGKLSLFQTGGDFNLSGIEIYTGGGGSITYNTITQRSSYSSPSDSTGSSLSLNKPSGTIAGDVMVAHVVINSASSTITTPSGWTLLRRDNTSTSMASVIFYKVATASEPSSYSWSFGTSRNSAGGIATYMNVDPNSPIDAHGGQYNQDTSTMTAPSITTTVANGRLLYIGAASANSSVSGPSGMTQQWRVGSSSMSLLAEKALTNAGSTGTVTATNTLTGESNTAALVALKPSVQSAPPPDYGTITLRSTSQANNGSGSTSLTISKPTGAISGDVLVAQIIAGTPSTTISAPSGWTLIRRDNSNSLLGVALYYRVLGDNEPLSYSWGVSPSNVAVGGIAAYYNVDVLDPIDAHSGQFNQSVQNMTAPSVTTSTPGDKLLFFGAVAVTATVTTPTGFTTQWNTGSQRISHMSDRNLSNAGATGNVVGQHNQANQSNISQLVALRPALEAAPTSGPLPGSITNLNFSLTNFNPWMQTVCGDFRSDNSFDNPIPAAQSMMVTNPSCSSPGIVYSGDTSASFGGGQSSSTGQVVGGYSYPEVYAPNSGWGIATSYDYLKQKSQSGGINSINLATICPTLTNCTLPGGLAKGIYYANGDVGLNAYTYPAGQDYVFLINGNLTFLGNVVVPVNVDTSVVYSVSGDIIIPNTLGVAPAVTTTNLSGIFSADRSFIVESTNTCADLRLNLAGALIVNAGRNGGTMQNNRDLCGNNILNPSLQIVQRLDMVLTMPEFVKLQRVTSEEVAP